MDDFPAGPASPEPRRPSLSVVIPVHNGGQDFERCLRRLRDSTWTDYELVVVDDGSTDDSARRAAAYGARVLRHDAPRGPAAARNAGAQAASAPLVFFLDADVALHRDALAQAVRCFERDPALAAIFGSYDAVPPAPGLVSQFRNLLHHFVHQQGTFRDGARPVQTFWTGCGAIRRQVFLDHGGFDPHLYRRPAIEDIELGYRITRAGHRIELVRDLQGTHLKRWTLRKVVVTDIFRRGVPWMLLLWRLRHRENDLNVSLGQRVCVLLTGIALLALAASPWVSGALAVVLASLALIVAINLPFYRFLARVRGLAFAAASLPLHCLYYGCCGASVFLAWCIRLRLGIRPEPEPSADDAGPHARPRRDRGSIPSRPRRPEPSRRAERWTNP